MELCGRGALVEVAVSAMALSPVNPAPFKSALLQIGLRLLVVGFIQEP
jgi:hypothetical protein